MGAQAKQKRCRPSATRAPTETGSPSGPKREWPLGHRCKDAAAGQSLPRTIGRGCRPVAPAPAPERFNRGLAPGRFNRGQKSEASAEQRPTERPVAAPSATGYNPYPPIEKGYAFL